MFGYVTQREFDAEREAHIRAAARCAELLLSIQDWKQMYLDSVKSREYESESHAKEMQDLLDRALPKPIAPVPGFGVVGDPKRASYEEIMRMPAVGKRGVRERNAAARDAKIQDEEEENDKTVATRRATLSPEEQAIVDKTIPVV